MNLRNTSRLYLRSAVCLPLIGAGILVGCLADPEGITTPNPMGSAGSKTSSAGSAMSPDTNEAGAATAGTSAAQGGSGGQDHHEATGGDAPEETGGTLATGTGGTPENPEPGAGGAGGGDDGESGEGVHIPAACTFHSDPAPHDAGGGGGGTGGAPATALTLQVSPFLGGYLADTAGRTLYVYGADLPGDCSTPPKSNCTTVDCLLTWPPFDAGARTLPAELADAGFGTIARPEGGYQTTYMGWPLYYNKSDLTLGQMTGQGKGKTWHVAETVLPNVMIMKAGAVKYLADASGHTLYVSAADVAGKGNDDPVSNCDKACLAVFEPFRVKSLSTVSSLDPLDFGDFVRHGQSGLQLAYKGLPLYRAATDTKPGDMNGATVTGFTAAVP